MSIVCRRLANPTDAEANTALDVLVEGFQGYHFFYEMMEDRKDILVEHLRARLVPAFEGAEVGVTPGLKPADLPLHQRMVEENVRPLYSPAHKTWVDTEYKQFLAFLDDPSLSDIKANSYEILLIATHPSARRRGLAPALLEAIRQRAHDDGKEVMLLTQCTERAEGTYARAGYRTVHQTELVYRDGERDPWFVMVR
ncbi:hypothetical protein EHS25_008672 [Saitozyma podzolica]|uniref:N-acetyltransferase domain-containing protein n=1 Tax=Saitozyma podzolica TaxID=1890683 RepID=A0A427YMH4_9TREE|nr:hypothetical protein EHS25_008672 [Saitozyma podzolica]